MKHVPIRAGLLEAGEADWVSAARMEAMPDPALVRTRTRMSWFNPRNARIEYLGDLRKHNYRTDAAFAAEVHGRADRGELAVRPHRVGGTPACAAASKKSPRPSPQRRYRMSV